MKHSALDGANRCSYVPMLAVAILPYLGSASVVVNFRARACTLRSNHELGFFEGSDIIGVPHT
ncbi:hypothetical protein SLEP1_g7445 [Rubroshorea leprosula]|uniref:Uncharacterized protein n=2 Tax=Rubroshorea leprosula TaxID=152421 RepID=A0AAV5I6Q2_9ROSI|nr:hypothetical protein SLEP1_g7445 [Rubroshorea leprosula]